MAKCFLEFGWQGMEGDAIKGLRKSENRDMLSSIAWREVRNMWQTEMEEGPKLGMLNEIAALECESSCSFEKEERHEYDDEVKGRYSCIPYRGGKVERSGEGRQTMQEMQWWRSGRCLPLDCETAPGRGSQPV